MEKFASYYMDAEVTEALHAALDLMKDLNYTGDEVIALLYVLVNSRASLLRRILVKLDVEINLLELELRAYLKKSIGKCVWDNSLSHIVTTAYSNVTEEGDIILTGVYLLKVVVYNKQVKGILSDSNVPLKALHELMDEDKGTHGEVSNLNVFGVDLTEMARKGKLDPIVGRISELQTMTRTLIRRTKCNVILVGEPGVGKSALVEGLAQMIVKGQIPALSKYRLFSLDLTALEAGTDNRGDLEKRVKVVLDEVKTCDVIIFIDEMHMVKRGLANMLKPMLARGELKCIGATTPAEYREYLEEDGAFNRRFRKLVIDEASAEACISIMRRLKPRYEVHHAIRIDDEAIIEATSLANRYMPASFLPDKALDILDEACAMVALALAYSPESLQATEEKLKVKADAIVSLSIDGWKHEREISRLQVDARALENEVKKKTGDVSLERDSIKEMKRIRRHLEVCGGNQDQFITLNKTLHVLGEGVCADHVAQVVSKRTGIPVSKLNATQAQSLLELTSRLSKRVVGQTNAIEAVSNAIIRSRTGLARPHQPIGNFLFLGPTGVGKTELAKALAAELFHDENCMVRLDMSEYAESHTISRLIGSPPGYVGHHAGGQLTEAIRNKPNQLILLDEIEKANSCITNLLLGVLDDARLTDGKGRTVDFSSTLIIMTSNLGHRHILDESKVMAEVKSFFSPEFMNRLDATIIFNPLTRPSLKEIVRLQINAINHRLLPNSIHLSPTKPFMDHLLNQFSNSNYGARPLRRYLESKIITKLAKSLLTGDVSNNSFIQINFDPKNAITFIIHPSKHA